MYFLRKLRPFTKKLRQKLGKVYTIENVPRTILTPLTIYFIYSSERLFSRIKSCRRFIICAIRFQSRPIKPLISTYTHEVDSILQIRLNVHRPPPPSNQRVLRRIPDFCCYFNVSSSKAAKNKRSVIIDNRHWKVFYQE